jgi:CheY-like chemotaxis protein
VDDDFINLKVMVNLLKRRKFQSATATNGQRCLELLAQEKFDLILLDIQMPEMDGYETAKQIRALENQQTPGPPKRTPIVALTTVSEPGTRDRCLEAGMDDHLTKPVNTQQLFATLQRHLGLNDPTT